MAQLYSSRVMVVGTLLVLCTLVLLPAHSNAEPAADDDGNTGSHAPPTPEDVIAFLKTAYTQPHSPGAAMKAAHAQGAPLPDLDVGAVLQALHGDGAGAGDGTAPLPEGAVYWGGMLCHDDCEAGQAAYSCDDGGYGSSTSACAYGHDCRDCGPRPADGKEQTSIVNTKATDNALPPYLDLSLADPDASDHNINVNAATQAAKSGEEEAAGVQQAQQPNLGTAAEPNIFDAVAGAGPKPLNIDAGAQPSVHSPGNDCSSDAVPVAAEEAGMGEPPLVPHDEYAAQFIKYEEEGFAEWDPHFDVGASMPPHVMEALRNLEFASADDDAAAATRRRRRLAEGDEWEYKPEGGEHEEAVLSSSAAPFFQFQQHQASADASADAAIKAFNDNLDGGAADHTVDDYQKEGEALADASQDFVDALALIGGCQPECGLASQDSGNAPGDGRCQPECASGACGFDGGDCCNTDLCKLFWLGDGVCHSECDTPACGFDGGDCVPVECPTEGSPCWVGAECGLCDDRDICMRDSPDPAVGGKCIKLANCPPEFAVVCEAPGDCQCRPCSSGAECGDGYVCDTTGAPVLPGRCIVPEACPAGATLCGGRCVSDATACIGPCPAAEKPFRCATGDCVASPGACPLHPSDLLPNLQEAAKSAQEEASSQSTDATHESPFGFEPITSASETAGTDYIIEQMPSDEFMQFAGELMAHAPAYVPNSDFYHAPPSATVSPDAFTDDSWSSTEEELRGVMDVVQAKLEEVVSHGEASCLAGGTAEDESGCAADPDCGPGAVPCPGSNLCAPDTASCATAADPNPAPGNEPCGDHMVRCWDASCATSTLACPCAPGRVRCPDKPLCVEDAAECVNKLQDITSHAFDGDPGGFDGCLPTQVVCFDGTCSSAGFAGCPCPPEAPVKCPGAHGMCARAASFCNPTCPEDPGTGMPAHPCWDSSCPKPDTGRCPCPPEYPITCPHDGTCVDSASECHVPYPPCALNCPLHAVGDGICDPACEVEACSWDGGDCGMFDRHGEAHDMMMEDGDGEGPPDHFGFRRRLLHHTHGVAHRRRARAHRARAHRRHVAKLIRHRRARQLAQRGPGRRMAEEAAGEQSKEGEELHFVVPVQAEVLGKMHGLHNLTNVTQQLKLMYGDPEDNSPGLYGPGGMLDVHASPTCWRAMQDALKASVYDAPDAEEKLAAMFPSGVGPLFGEPEDFEGVAKYAGEHHGEGDDPGPAGMAEKENYGGRIACPSFGEHMDAAGNCVLDDPAAITKAALTGAGPAGDASAGLTTSALDPALSAAFAGVQAHEKLPSPEWGTGIKPSDVVPPGLDLEAVGEALASVAKEATKGEPETQCLKLDAGTAGATLALKLAGLEATNTVDATLLGSDPAAAKAALDGVATELVEKFMQAAGITVPLPADGEEPIDAVRVEELPTQPGVFCLRFCPEAGNLPELDVESGGAQQPHWTPHDGFINPTVAEHPHPAGCAEAAPHCPHAVVANGVCDPFCNVPACGFDGGDCATTKEAAMVQEHGLYGADTGLGDAAGGGGSDYDAATQQAMEHFIIASNALDGMDDGMWPHGPGDAFGDPTKGYDLDALATYADYHGSGTGDDLLGFGHHGGPGGAGSPGGSRRLRARRRLLSRAGGRRGRARGSRRARRRNRRLLRSATRTPRGLMTAGDTGNMYDPYGYATYGASCAGRCGGFADGCACFCDAACVTRGDCCADIKDVCTKEDVESSHVVVDPFCGMTAPHGAPGSHTYSPDGATGFHYGDDSQDNAFAGDYGYMYGTGFGADAFGDVGAFAEPYNYETEHDPAYDMYTHEEEVSGDGGDGDMMKDPYDHPMVHLPVVGELLGMLATVEMALMPEASHPTGSSDAFAPVQPPAFTDVDCAFPEDAVKQACAGFANTTAVNDYGFAPPPYAGEAFDVTGHNAHDAIDAAMHDYMPASGDEDGDAFKGTGVGYGGAYAAPSASPCSHAVAGDAAMPQPLHQCWNGDCVPTPDDCPCPRERAFRCPDHSCAWNASACFTPCPHGQVQCWEADVCAPDARSCPCLPGHTRCPPNATTGGLGVCVPDASMCQRTTPDASGHAGPQCPLERPIVCDNGQCAESIEACGCPVGAVKCPGAHQCVSELSACPARPVCPHDKPVQCPSGECRIHALDCPAATACPAGTAVCPAGSKHACGVVVDIGTPGMNHTVIDCGDIDECPFDASAPGTPCTLPECDFEQGGGPDKRACWNATLRYCKGSGASDPGCAELPKFEDGLEEQIDAVFDAVEGGAIGGTLTMTWDGPAIDAAAVGAAPGASSGMAPGDEEAGMATGEAKMASGSLDGCPPERPFACHGPSGAHLCVVAAADCPADTHCPGADMVQCADGSCAVADPNTGEHYCIGDSLAIFAPLPAGDDAAGAPSVEEEHSFAALDGYEGGMESAGLGVKVEHTCPDGSMVTIDVDGFAASSMGDAFAMACGGSASGPVCPSDMPVLCPTGGGAQGGVAGMCAESIALCPQPGQPPLMTDAEAMYYDEAHAHGGAVTHDEYGLPPTMAAMAAELDMPGVWELDSEHHYYGHGSGDEGATEARRRRRLRRRRRRGRTLSVEEEQQDDDAWYKERPWQAILDHPIGLEMLDEDGDVHGPPLGFTDMAYYEPPASVAGELPSVAQVSDWEKSIEAAYDQHSGMEVDESGDSGSHELEEVYEPAMAHMGRVLDTDAPLFPVVIKLWEEVQVKRAMLDVMNVTALELQGLACRPLQKRCPGTAACIPRNATCPPVPACPPHMVTCPIDRSCRHHAEDCPRPVVHGEPLGDCAMGVPCPDGSCAPNMLECGTPPVCHPDTPILCATGECVATTGDCADLGPEFAATGPGMVHCHDGSAATSMADCPASLQCPPNHIKCALDGSCRHSIADCPKPQHVDCPYGLHPFPGGCCGISEADCMPGSSPLAPTHAVAPPGHVLCADNSFAMAVHDCPGAPEAAEWYAAAAGINDPPAEFKLGNPEGGPDGHGDAMYVGAQHLEELMHHMQPLAYVDEAGKGEAVDAMMASVAEFQTISPPTATDKEMLPDFPCRDGEVFLCPDGACRKSLQDCPSAVAHVMAAAVGGFAPIAAAAGAPGAPSMGGGGGAANTAPSVRCWDDSVRQAVADCPPALGMACPGDSKRCPGGGCSIVDPENPGSSFCPSARTCLPPFNFRCPNDRCVREAAECAGPAMADDLGALAAGLLAQPCATPADAISFTEVLAKVISLVRSWPSAQDLAARLVLVDSMESLKYATLNFFATHTAGPGDATSVYGLSAQMEALMREMEWAQAPVRCPDGRCVQAMEECGVLVPAPQPTTGPGASAGVGSDAASTGVASTPLVSVPAADVSTFLADKAAYVADPTKPNPVPTTLRSCPRDKPVLCVDACYETVAACADHEAVAAAVQLAAAGTALGAGGSTPGTPDTTRVPMDAAGDSSLQFDAMLASVQHMPKDAWDKVSAMAAAVDGAGHSWEDSKDNYELLTAMADFGYNPNDCGFAAGLDAAFKDALEAQPVGTDSGNNPAFTSVAQAVRDAPELVTAMQPVHASAGVGASVVGAVNVAPDGTVSTLAHGSLDIDGDEGGYHMPGDPVDLKDVYQQGSQSGRRLGLGAGRARRSLGEARTRHRRRWLEEAASEKQQMVSDMLAATGHTEAEMEAVMKLFESRLDAELKHQEALEAADAALKEAGCPDQHVRCCNGDCVPLSSGEIMLREGHLESAADVMAAFHMSEFMLQSLNVGPLLGGDGASSSRRRLVGENGLMDVSGLVVGDSVRVGPVCPPCDAGEAPAFGEGYGAGAEHLMHPPERFPYQPPGDDAAASASASDSGSSSDEEHREWGEDVWLDAALAGNPEHAMDLVDCGDGTAAFSWSECHAVHECGVHWDGATNTVIKEERCADGTCMVACPTEVWHADDPVGDGSANTEAKLDASRLCPAGSVRCHFSGQCAPSLAACSLPNGCTESAPFQCASGDCVVADADCLLPQDIAMLGLQYDGAFIEDHHLHMYADDGTTPAAITPEEVILGPLVEGSAVHARSKEGDAVNIHLPGFAPPPPPPVPTKNSTLSKEQHQWHAEHDAEFAATDDGLEHLAPGEEFKVVAAHVANQDAFVQSQSDVFAAAIVKVLVDPDSSVDTGAVAADFLSGGYFSNQGQAGSEASTLLAGIALATEIAQKPETATMVADALFGADLPPKEGPAMRHNESMATGGPIDDGFAFEDDDCEKLGGYMCGLLEMAHVKPANRSVEFVTPADWVPPGYDSNKPAVVPKLQNVTTPAAAADGGGGGDAMVVYESVGADYVDPLPTGEGMGFFRFNGLASVFDNTQAMDIAAHPETHGEEAARNATMAVASEIAAAFLHGDTSLGHSREVLACLAGHPDVFRAAAEEMEHMTGYRPTELEALTQDNCPLLTPHRCEDSGQCVRQAGDCLNPNACPEHSPIRCGSVCAATCADAAAEVQCEPGFIRSPDGGCVQNALAASVVGAACPVHKPHVCPDGSCSPNPFECAGAPVGCKELEVTCADGSCAAPGQCHSVQPCEAKDDEGNRFVRCPGSSPRAGDCVPRKYDFTCLYDDPEVTPGALPPGDAVVDAVVAKHHGMFDPEGFEGQWAEAGEAAGSPSPSRRLRSLRVRAATHTSALAAALRGRRRLRSLQLSRKLLPRHRRQRARREQQRRLLAQARRSGRALAGSGEEEGLEMGEKWDMFEQWDGTTAPDAKFFDLGAPDHKTESAAGHGCPPGAFRCGTTGECVHDPATGCPAHRPGTPNCADGSVLCADGSCAARWAECVERATCFANAAVRNEEVEVPEEFLGDDATPYGDHVDKYTELAAGNHPIVVCSDGSCARSVADCPPVPRGPVGSRACADGSLVPMAKPCPPVAACPHGNVRCGDGICRPAGQTPSGSPGSSGEAVQASGGVDPYCPRMIGCGYWAPIMCPTGLCARTPAECRGQCAVGQFECADGRCVLAMRGCDSPASAAAPATVSYHLPPPVVVLPAVDPAGTSLVADSDKDGDFDKEDAKELLKAMHNGPLEGDYGEGDLSGAMEHAAAVDGSELHSDVASPDAVAFAAVPPNPPFVLPAVDLATGNELGHVSFPPGCLGGSVPNAFHEMAAAERGGSGLGIVSGAGVSTAVVPGDQGSLGMSKTEEAQYEATAPWTPRDIDNELDGFFVHDTWGGLDNAGPTAPDAFAFAAHTTPPAPQTAGDGSASGSLRGSTTTTAANGLTNGFDPFGRDPQWMPTDEEGKAGESDANGGHGFDAGEVAGGDGTGVDFYGAASPLEQYYIESHSGMEHFFYTFKQANSEGLMDEGEYKAPSSDGGSRRVLRQRRALHGRGALVGARASTPARRHAHVATARAAHRRLVQEAHMLSGAGVQPDLSAPRHCISDVHVIAGEVSRSELPAGVELGGGNLNSGAMDASGELLEGNIPKPAPEAHLVVIRDAASRDDPECVRDVFTAATPDCEGRGTAASTASLGDHEVEPASPGARRLRRAKRRRLVVDSSKPADLNEHTASEEAIFLCLQRQGDEGAAEKAPLTGLVAKVPAEGESVPAGYDVVAEDVNTEEARGGPNAGTAHPVVVAALHQGEETPLEPAPIVEVRAVAEGDEYPAGFEVLDQVSLLGDKHAGGRYEGDGAEAKAEGDVFLAVRRSHDEPPVTKLDVGVGTDCVDPTLWATADVVWMNVDSEHEEAPRLRCVVSANAATHPGAAITDVAPVATLPGAEAFQVPEGYGIAGVATNFERRLDQEPEPADEEGEAGAKLEPETQVVLAIQRHKAVEMGGAHPGPTGGVDHEAPSFGSQCHGELCEETAPAHAAEAEHLAGGGTPDPTAQVMLLKQEPSTVTVQDVPPAKLALVARPEAFCPEMLDYEAPAGVPGFGTGDEVRCPVWETPTEGVMSAPLDIAIPAHVAAASGGAADGSTHLHAPVRVTFKGTHVRPAGGKEFLAFCVGGVFAGTLNTWQCVGDILSVNENGDVEGEAYEIPGPLAIISRVKHVHVPALYFPTEFEAKVEHTVVSADGVAQSFDEEWLWDAHRGRSRVIRRCCTKACIPCEGGQEADHEARSIRFFGNGKLQYDVVGDLQTKDSVFFADEKRWEFQCSQKPIAEAVCSGSDAANSGDPALQLQCAHFAGRMGDFAGSRFVRLATLVLLPGSAVPAIDEVHGERCYHWHYEGSPATGDGATPFAVDYWQSVAGSVPVLLRRVSGGEVTVTEHFHFATMDIGLAPEYYEDSFHPVNGIAADQRDEAGFSAQCPTDPTQKPAPVAVDESTGVAATVKRPLLQVMDCPVCAEAITEEDSEAADGLDEYFRIAANSDSDNLVSPAELHAMLAGAVGNGGSEGDAGFISLPSALDGAFVRYDVDGDERLDVGEFSFFAMDANADAHLSLAELRRLNAHTGASGSLACGQCLMAVADRDGDGVLSGEEVAMWGRVHDAPLSDAAKAKRTEMREEALRGSFEGMDSNSDGLLSTAEAEGALAAWSVAAGGEVGTSSTSGSVTGAEIVQQMRDKAAQPPPEWATTESSGEEKDDMDAPEGFANFAQYKAMMESVVEE